MRVNTNGAGAVSTAGAAATANFSIAATGKAFDILSSGLYSRKEEAVLRELAVNGVDAHIAAGKVDTPIEVQLPTEEDPVFHVRDFGIGLSKEDAMSLYTTYFASTKSESNDFTGAFGLGSKAPYAYTDTFTVVSTHEGVRRTFICAKEEAGGPQIMLFSEEPTSDANGVEVSFPVEPRDFQAFQAAAERVFAYFTVPPVVLGGPTVKARTYELSLEIPEIPGAKVHFGEGVTGVLMGNVLYPISFGEVGSKAPVLTTQYSKEKMVLEVPIGLVSVAASREELQYDRTSKANLVHALESAEAALKRWIAAKVQTTRDRVGGSPVLHCQAFLRLSLRFPVVYKAFQSCLDAATWTAVSTRTVSLHYFGLTGVSALRYGTESNRYGWGKRALHLSSTFDISANLESLQVWWCDTAGGETRVRAHLRQEHPKGPETHGLKAVLLCSNETAVKALLAQLGLPVEFVRKASTLKAVERSRRNTAADVRGRLTGQVGVLAPTSGNKPTKRELGDAMTLSNGLYVVTTVGVSGINFELPGFGELGQYSGSGIGAHDFCRYVMEPRFGYLKEALPKYVMAIPASMVATVQKQVATLAKEIEDDEEREQFQLTELGDWLAERVDFKAIQRDARLYCQLGVSKEARGMYGQKDWFALKQRVATSTDAIRDLLVETLNAADKGLGDLLVEYAAEETAKHFHPLPVAPLLVAASKAFPAEVMGPTGDATATRLAELLTPAQLDLDPQSNGAKGVPAEVAFKALLLLCGVSLRTLAEVYGELGSAAATTSTPSVPKVKARKVEQSRAQLSLVFDADTMSAMLRRAA